MKERYGYLILALGTIAAIAALAVLLSFVL